MFLKATAHHWMTEKFLLYNEEEDRFGDNDLVGRLGPVDRFLSIYNRPTRMRQMFLKGSVDLPDCKIMKHSTTGEIYLIGGSRQDARGDIDDGDPYESIVMAHLASPGPTSGLCSITRKVLPTDENDMQVYGWLEDKPIYETYIDLEFRTSSAEKGTYDERVGDYYGWLSDHVQLLPWDYITLNDQAYRVVDVYSDMGFIGIRADKKPDPRINVEIKTSDRVYDNATHTFTNDGETHKVTVIIPDDTDAALWANPQETSIQVIVPTSNIGIRPEPNMKVTYQGVDRIIKSCFLQASDTEYRLECE